MNIKNECKDKEDIYNQKLSTPVAVNIPQPEYNNCRYYQLMILARSCYGLIIDDNEVERIFLN